MTKLRQLLLFVFSVMLVALNYPLLSLFNKNIILAGIPLLFWYVFFMWLLLIFLGWYISRRINNNQP